MTYLLPSAEPQGFKPWQALQQYSLHSFDKSLQRAFDVSARKAAMPLTDRGDAGILVLWIKSNPTWRMWEEMARVWVM